MLYALARLLVLLPLICILAYLTVRFGLGRFGRFAAYGAGKRMRVLEQVSLGPKCGLTLVQVGERYLLFAHQEHAIILVSDSDKPPGEITGPQQGWPAAGPGGGRVPLAGVNRPWKNVFPSNTFKSNMVRREKRDAN